MVMIRDNKFDVSKNNRVDSLVGARIKQMRVQVSS
jgi:hypothetical protein